MARAAQQQQSLASGAAFGGICHQTTRLAAPLFAAKLRRRTMMTAIKWGLVAIAVFASAYVVETRAILALESSDSGRPEYVP
jgi:hypothetical protein